MYCSIQIDSEVEYKCCKCGESIYETYEDQELEIEDLEEQDRLVLTRKCEECDQLSHFRADNIDHNESENEIYEHWIVTDWLASKLQEYGHETCEIFDFTIWGRPCTGQAICLDYVIQKIAWDLWEDQIIEAQKAHDRDPKNKLDRLVFEARSILKKSENDEYLDTDQVLEFLNKVSAS